MVVAALSEATGVPEGPLALFVAMLACYPIALAWRLLPNDPLLKHLYSLTTGFAVVYFAYNLDALVHGTITTCVTWLLLTFLPTRLSLPIGWVFNVAYLMAGYYYYLSPDGYTLNWTTPQCVLTLRLIGLCFDVSDGQLSPGAMDKDAKARHLKSVPGLFQTLSFCFHFGGALVGPQFPYRLFEDFVNGDLVPEPRPSSGYATLQCFAGGILYIAISQVFGIIYPPTVVLTEEYLASRPFPIRFAEIVLCSRGFMYRYLGVWKLGEAPNILTGLSYNGQDENGQPKWDGATNIYLAGYEFATRLQHIIQNFNINTNYWLKVYVMKRLRGFGNKNIAQLGSLMFLAMWHGPYLGYFFSFAMEFLDMLIERELFKLTQLYTEPWFKDDATLVQKTMGRVYCVFTWLLTAVALALGAIPFIQLTLHKSFVVFNSIYWICHIPYVLLFLYLALKPKSRKKEA